jgi:chlorobactene glucosyltransferase
VLAGLLLPAALFLGPAMWRLWRVSAELRGRACLPRASAARPSAGPDLVSVLVPARNEERGVGACVGSLAAQTYPHLEIVAIDDGSSDRTPEILAELARREPRIQVLRVDGPAPGWTGKVFALASGAAVARGRWLCFTDADTVHAPESITRAVGFAEAHGVALLSLTSRQLTGSFWERWSPGRLRPLVKWFPWDRDDPAVHSPPPTESSSWSRDAYRPRAARRVTGEISRTSRSRGA